MGRKKKNKNIEEESSKPNTRVSNLKGDAKRSVVAVILFSLAIISVLGFAGKAGAFGEFLDKYAGLLIGWVRFIFPLFLIISGVVLIFRKETSFYVTKLIGLGLALLSFIGVAHWFFEAESRLSMATAGQGGGFTGYILNYLLVKSLGEAGSFVVILAMFFLGIIVAFNFSLMHIFGNLRKKKSAEETEEEKDQSPKDEKPTEPVLPVAENKNESLSESETLAEKEKAEEMEASKNIARMEFVEGRDQYIDPRIEAELENSSERKNQEFLREERQPRKRNPKWTLPPVDLLERSYGSPNGGDDEKNFSIIEKTLKDFGINVERGGAKTGPAVTQYSFRPAVGVKIAKILSLQNDLSLALAAHPIRIEAPIPGQSLIGIEIPNKTSTMVRLRDMVEETKFKRSAGLTLALGKDVSGENIFSDLAKMPHLMIAGSTGTGKSVCINTIITTLLYQYSPEDLRFIMVDPKRVELSLYNDIPHLLTPVVVENKKVINVLKWAVEEMERRYRILQDTGSRDLTSYREKIKIGETIKRTDPETNEVTEEQLKKMPYIVIVIDELADLMSSHGKEVESAIVRIAQMARAVGIHLIVSTQRPSVEVITGLIKANITTRIAFQVATQIDSRTILDMGGAEKLLGRGDMLFLSSSSPKPKRIQGVFISESEVKLVVKFIREQKEKSKKGDDGEKESIAQEDQKEILEFKSAETQGGSDDELLQEAQMEIMRSKKASASFLQRRLRIGYARAARLLDILEEKGIIGPADGAKPREIYALNDSSQVDYADKLEDQAKRDKWEI